ncbi:MAG: HAD family phosphatase [Solobacterium sp.]|nr:HAD family phosphatase [Solobacterium sp.]
MIRAVLFDCDGTLLSHKTNRVPNSARTALERLRRNGIKVILCTGRHRSELRDLHQLDGLDFDAYITVNGACTYDHRGILSSCPISAETRQTVYEYLSSHELPVQFFLNDDTFISCVNETVIQSQAAIHTPVPPIGDLSRIIREPVYLMVPFGIAEAEEMIALLKDVQVTRWNQHDAIDIVSTSAGKGVGVKAIMDAYGLKKEELMGFGDAMNDAGMLEEVGTAVVMGNGEEPLKKMADYVTDDIDEDGVSHALIALGVLREEELECGNC